jgi:hypothetical protein
MKENTVLVSFRVDPKTWHEFLNICHDKDMSGSQVLRNYVGLVVKRVLRIADKRMWEHRG